jgi:hypothetical protein
MALSQLWHQHDAPPAARAGHWTRTAPTDSSTSTVTGTAPPGPPAPAAWPLAVPDGRGEPVLAARGGGARVGTIGHRAWCGCAACFGALDEAPGQDPARSDDPAAVPPAR